MIWNKIMEGFWLGVGMLVLLPFVISIIVGIVFMILLVLRIITL